MTRGAALPATLFALAITSAMAVGGVHVARRHKASTLDRNAASVLRPRSEALAVNAIASWDSVARAEQLIGTTATVDSSAAAAVWVTRTREMEYLIVAEARTPRRPTFYQRIGVTVVVQAGRPRLPFPRAWTLLP